MGIDGNANDLIPLKEAAMAMDPPTESRRLWHWCREGLSLMNGGRLRLQHTMRGCLYYTRPSWVAEFQEAVQADRRVEPGKAKRVGRGKSRRSVKTNGHARAESDLKRAGM